MTLKTAALAMARSATDEKVGLVIRFNGDDSKLVTIWSEGSGEGLGEGNPTIQNRPAMFRPTEVENQWRAANKVSDAAGYHAEELMIACWDYLLTQVTLLESAITTVEMVLSKSPCYGIKGSSPLKLPVDTIFESGCSKKLEKFIKSKSKTIKWYINYIALAGAKTVKYDWIGYSGHRGFMTREELDLDMWRRLNVWYRDNIKSDMLSFADFWEKLSGERSEELQKLKLQLGNKSLGKSEKDVLVKKLQTYVSEMKKFSKHSLGLKTEVRDKSNEFVEKARLSSLYTAQHGISLLQCIINVDVNRWKLHD